MHYKNGEPAQVGDRCTFEHYTTEKGKHQVEGLIFALTASAETCNAQVAYPLLEYQGGPDGKAAALVRLNYNWVTLKECTKTS